MEDYTLYLKSQEEARQILNNNKLFQFCENRKMASLLYTVTALNFCHCFLLSIYLMVSF